jgi:hypothetical protein
VRDGQTSPHKPKLVVPHSTCPSLSPSPPANSFIIGPAVINTHTIIGPAVINTHTHSTIGARGFLNKRNSLSVISGVTYE